MSASRRDGFPMALVRIAGLVYLCLACVAAGWILHERTAVELGGQEPWPPVADTAWLRERPLPVGAPFRIASGDEASRVVGSYWGVARLDEEGVSLSLHVRSNVRVHPAFPERYQVTLDSLTLALAQATPAGWAIWREGEGLHLDQPLVSVDGGVQSFSFEEPLELKGVGAVDLVGRWPVLVHTVVLYDPDRQEEERMRLYHHGTREIFDDLVRPRPWERPGWGGLFGLSGL